MSVPLESLRDEHRRLVIGPQIADLLGRVVRATAPTYPPAEYGAAGGWTTEALEDLLHDWVTERLLARGDLAVMLRTAASPRSLRASLTTSLSQFLINRRRRTSASNLYRRTAQMLRTSNEFEAISSPSSAGDQLWTVSATPQRMPTPLSITDLVQIASGLSDEQLAVVRYGPYSLKSSPILREPALRTFLTFLFERAAGSVSLATIAEVMRRRFRLVELEDVQLDETVEAAEPAVPIGVEYSMAADSVLAHMGSDRTTAIREFERTGGDLGAAGTAIGGGVPEGEKAVAAVLQLIAEIASSTDEARAIYAALIEKLF